MSSYGMQIAAYSHEGDDFVGFLEDLQDYPKALTIVRGADGAPYLLAGCRTGILSLYLMDRPVKQGIFAKLEDRWLPRRPAQYRLAATSHGK
ncbi:hypothetical protein ACGF13_28445 [Kitasatospora sp. NPDC048286]|uniref:hypothetical protein n=1 Tax=Kitasatospora sp. NPDC048286 TaxID=3364047 RepID=UPI00371BE3B3